MHDNLTPTPDQLVEDALRSHPAAPMPRSITGDVMARIQGIPAPRFRLTRWDYLLAFLLTAIFSSIVYGLQFLPELVVLQLRIQAVLIWQSLLVNARWLTPALFFGLASLLAALTLPSLFILTLDRRR